MGQSKKARTSLYEQEDVKQGHHYMNKKTYEVLESQRFQSSKKSVDDEGFDPSTSRMLSVRSTN